MGFSVIHLFFDLPISIFSGIHEKLATKNVLTVMVSPRLQVCPPKTFSETLRNTDGTYRDLRKIGNSRGFGGFDSGPNGQGRLTSYDIIFRESKGTPPKPTPPQEIRS